MIFWSYPSFDPVAWYFIRMRRRWSTRFNQNSGARRMLSFIYAMIVCSWQIIIICPFREGNNNAIYWYLNENQLNLWIRNLFFVLKAMFKNRVGSKYSCPEIEASTVICHGSFNLFQKFTVMCYPLALTQDLDKIEHRIR